MTLSRRKVEMEFRSGRLLILLVLLGLITASNITGFYIAMISENQVYVINRGDTLNLECNFHADEYSLFECPVVWIKNQLDEHTNINLMSNINEPFLDTNRFEVVLTSDPPRYKFALHIQDVQYTDSGNYTCQIRGKNSPVLGHSTNQVFVRTPIDGFHFYDDKSLPLVKQSEFQKQQLILHDSINAVTEQPSNQLRPPLQQQPRQMLNPLDDDPSGADRRHVFRFVEGRPGRMGCFSLGGYPVPSLKITMGHRDVTSIFKLSGLPFLGGSTIGLKNVNFRKQLWSSNVTLTADDDRSKVSCVAAVPGLQVLKIEAVVDVVYEPKIICKSTSALLYDKNVFIDCRIKSKPQYFHVYWLLNVSMPSTRSSSAAATSVLSPSSARHNSSTSGYSSSPPPTFTLTSGSQHDGLWTVVTDRTDGVTEVQLYISEVTMDRYRAYTIVVENVVGVTTKKVSLLPKSRKVQTELLSDASVNSADLNQTQKILSSSSSSLSSSLSSSSSSSSSSTISRKFHEKVKPVSITLNNSAFIFRFLSTFHFIAIVVVVISFTSVSSSSLNM